METTVQMPVRFTEGAQAEIRRLLAEPGFDPARRLRVGVKGGGCSGLTYILDFDAKKEGDLEYEMEGYSFIMDKGAELYLFGMEIDWEGGLNSRGFTFKNPNASGTCGCGTSFSV